MPWFTLTRCSRSSWLRLWQRRPSHSPARCRQLTGTACHTSWVLTSHHSWTLRVTHSVNLCLQLGASQCWIKIRVHITWASSGIPSRSIGYPASSRLKFQRVDQVWPPISHPLIIIRQDWLPRHPWACSKYRSKHSSTRRKRKGGWPKKSGFRRIASHTSCSLRRSFRIRMVSFNPRRSSIRAGPQWSRPPPSWR